MNELSARQSFSWRDHWQLLPILAFGVALRFWQINESLWLDELHTAWVVSGSLGEIVERSQIGNQSPVYFYLPWASTSLLGMSEWALRLPSILAGVGLIAVAYVLAYQFTRSKIAAIACAVLATADHNFLFYSTETRPYAFVQLAAAFQLSVFWQLQDTASIRRRLPFVVSTALLCYLHYTAVLLVLGEVVYVLVQSSLRREPTQAPRYTWRNFATDLACAAVLAIPLAGHVLEVGTRRQAWTSFVNNTSLSLPIHWFSLETYIAVPTVLCLIIVATKVVVRLRGDDPNRREIELAPKAAATVGANGAVSSRRSGAVALLLVCWFVVPLSTVWILTTFKIAPLYLGRYVIGAAMAPVLFAGLCVGIWKHRCLQTVVAAVVIAYATYTNGFIDQLQYDARLFGDRTENWRIAVSYVNRDSTWDSPVFVRSGLLEADRLRADDSELLRDYCVCPLTSIYAIDRPAKEIHPLTTSQSGKLTASEVKMLEAAGSAWFVVNGTLLTRKRCAERVLRSLQTETKQGVQVAVVINERQFGNVGVFLVDLLELDDTLDPTPHDSQPTSPNSIAPP